MSFIVTAPAADPTEPAIISDEFWPQVDPVKVRTAQRIDNTITPERLRETLIEAIATINDRLSSWRAARVMEGYAKMENVVCAKVDNVSINLNRYQRAVGCYAKALLTERYRDFDTTAAGNKKADQLDPSIDDLYRDASWAVSDIIGTGRTTVELI